MLGTEVTEVAGMARTRGSYLETFCNKEGHWDYLRRSSGAPRIQIPMCRSWRSLCDQAFLSSGAGVSSIYPWSVAKKQVFPNQPLDPIHPCRRDG